MILTRISRGMARTAVLARHNLATYQARPKLSTSERTRRLIMFVLAARVMTLPIPVAAASSVSFYRNQSLNLQLPVAVEQQTLTAVIVGDSVSQVAAENERIAAAQKAEAEAKALAAKQAEERAAVVTVAKKVNTNKAGVSTTDYDAFFQKYFGNDWVIAKAICSAESGLNPTAVSPTNDHGLCQINWPSHSKKFNYDLSATYDPETNIRIAAQIYYSSGPYAWTVYRTGAYLRFMPAN
jgi:soluble lytic murein transglycosylase-like protein